MTTSSCACLWANSPRRNTIQSIRLRTRFVRTRRNHVTLSDVQRDGGDGGPGVSDFVGSLLYGNAIFLELASR